MFQTSGTLEEILAKEMKQEFHLCVLGSLEECKGLRAPLQGVWSKLTGLRKEPGFRVDPSSLRGMQRPAGSLRRLT